MEKSILRLSKLLTFSIMFFLIMNVNAGVNLIKNGDFSQMVSETQIKDWIISWDIKGIAPAPSSKWIREKNPSGSNYFLSMNNTFVVQFFSSIPVGIYKFSANVIYWQG